MRVGDVMSRHVITIGESDSCQETVARMHRARVRHLPVLGPAGRLIGIVTDRDLRHHLERQLERYRERDRESRRRPKKYYAARRALG